MNLLRTFESRVSDAFGAGASGKPAPFSFKKLAKRAARAMEAETFQIDGVDTAPALYTILVAPADDAVMRPLYRELTDEVCGFVEAQADAKGYAFVGRPLARFMVDPSLRAGRFAVFAENVDSHTLGRLREEEEAFVKGSSGIGGAAARPAQPAPRKASPAEPRKAAHAEPAERLEAQVPSWEEIQAPAAEEFAPLVAPLAGDASAGLNVLPTDFVDDSVQEAGVAAEDVAPASPAMDIPPTVRRSVPLVNPRASGGGSQLPAHRPPERTHLHRRLAGHHHRQGAHPGRHRAARPQRLAQARRAKLRRPRLAHRRPWVHQRDQGQRHRRRQLHPEGRRPHHPGPHEP